MTAVRFQQPLEGGAVRCGTCAHGCRVADGARGLCAVMENRGGTLFSLVYGRAAAAGVDPIEKKPFFHFLPGAAAFSIATVGCNLRCLNCQNSDLSQMPRDEGRIAGEGLAPEDVVRSAAGAGCPVIAYTYTEPAVYFDYAYDSAVLAQEAGLRNVFVTNGYFSEDSVRLAAPVLHAANVDLKAFRDETYRKVCGARLAPVLDAIRLMKRLGVWVEVTTLVIPGINDSDPELRDIARFVKSVDAGTPWHVSRFFPRYRMADRSATPVAALRRAVEIGLEEGLHFVYGGNAAGEANEHTFCPGCGKTVVERHGFSVTANRLSGGACPACGAAVPGVWT